MQNSEEQRYLERIKVLYVEDEVAIRENLARLLSRRVPTLYTATNGKEGLELYLEKRPDLVITDIRMPILSGLEMAREIRAISQHTPIVVTTAYNDEEFFLQAIDIGIDKYLKKPVHKAELLKVLTGLARNILQQKELMAKERLLRMVLDTHPEPILVYDQTSMVYANRSLLEELHCHSFDEFQGRIDRDEIISRSEESEKQSLRQLLTTLEAREGEQRRVYLSASWLDKSEEEELAYLAQVRMFEGQEERLAVFSDVTTLDRERRHYYDLSITDPLTGIYNRKKIHDLLEEERERAERYGESFSLIMLDLDYFKQVNDTYGHQVGDEVLQQLTAIVRGLIRRSDTIGRIGGEEFLLLAPQTLGPDAVKIAEKLRAAIEADDFSPVTSLTSSFGVAEYINGESIENLIGRVDQALYAAKHNGRNRVEFL